MVSFKNILFIFNVFSLSLGRHTVKIIAGEDADIKDFPYMAALLVDGNENCGGSIINENTVLLAAHCLFDWESALLTVAYGNTKWDEGTVTNVSKFILHENFDNSPPYKDDIAVLKVDPPIVFGETAQPIRLAQKNEPNPGGKLAIAAGWGDISSYPINPTNLQKVNLTIIDNKKCENIMKNTDLPVDSNKKICAQADMSDGKPRGLCYGDSGGPISIDGVQYGIASYAYDECGSAKYPTVFTRVAHYIDWLTDKL